MIPDDPTQATVDDPLAPGVAEPGAPEEGGVVVDVSEKPKGEVKSDEKPTQAAPSREPFESVESLKTAVTGAYRIITKLQREIESLKAGYVAPQASPAADKTPTPATPLGTPEEERLNQLVQAGPTGWIRAVEEIAEKRAAQIITQKEAERQFQAVQAQREQVRQGGLVEVVKRYPVLDIATGDPESPFSRMFNQVLDQHPEYATSEFGAKLAMRDTEDALVAQGIDPKQFQSKPLPANAEVISRNRTNQGYLPPGRPSGAKPGMVTLTKEQKDFCDHHKIPYENYAKMTRMSERGQEVTL